MSDLRIENMNFENMDFKQLRSAVKQCYKENLLLQDELAIMKRKYEDILYNLDTDNFSERIVKQGEDMYTKIEQNAEEISLQAERAEGKMAELSIKADRISSTVVKTLDEKIEMDEMPTKENTSVEEKGKLCVYNGEQYYYSSFDEEWKPYEEGIKTIFEQNAEGFEMTGNVSIKGNVKISGACVSGEKIAGVVLEGSVIKTGEGGNDTYSVYDDSGLRFYDIDDQIEGWAIEPNGSYGGTLKYYYNDAGCYGFGSGFLGGDGYSNTDMVIKALNGNRGRFVVDVADSGYSEVKFVGINNYNGDSESPCIYANEKLLATQDWVKELIDDKLSGI